MALCPSFVAAERRLLDALAREAKATAGTVLRSAGYRQHARGAWRLGRTPRGPTMTEALPPPDDPGAAPSRPSALAHLKDLLLDARTSREAAARFLDTYQAVTGATPARAIANLGGDPVGEVREWYLKRLCPADELEREAGRRHVAGLRADLLLAGDSPAERIMVDRALACYLAVQDAERNLARLHRKGEPPRLPDQKRLDHAQRRLLDVLKALDQVRKKTPASHRLKVILNVPAPPVVPGTTIELPTPPPPEAPR